MERTQGFLKGAVSFLHQTQSKLNTRTGPEPAASAAALQEALGSGNVGRIL